MSTQQTLFGNKTQHRIFTVLKNLENLPKTCVSREEDFTSIRIRHDQQYVPDFHLVWCSHKEHFRVYIEIANTDHSKVRAGYPICTIGSGFTAMGFGVLYSFLHKHRANNKEIKTVHQHWINKKT